jgi:UDP-N-acetylmuramyl pentapeptide phosphotransferase/UDP-N-acetylglucosamine-1-phosphate transferase
VIAGVVPAVLLSPQLRGGAGTAMLITALGFAVIGLVDDLVGGVPALWRLPLQFLPAIGCLPWLLAGLDGPAGWKLGFGVLVVLWLVAYLNAFNFMDGINGLAAGQALVTGTAWYLVGRSQDLSWLATMGAITAGSALAFTPFNFPRARVFLGDVGSYFFGGLLGAAAVAGLRAHVPVEAVLAPLAVYLADTASTLVRRVSRGEAWYEPHREHAYQRLMAHMGGSHTRTTLAVAGVMAACAALGSLSLLGSVPLRMFGDAGVVTLVAGYVMAPAVLDRLGRRQLVFA